MKNQFLSSTVAASLWVAAVTGWSEARAELPVLSAQRLGLYDGVNTTPDGEVGNAAYPVLSGAYTEGYALQYVTTDGGLTYQPSETAASVWAANINTGVTHPLGLQGDGVHTLDLVYPYAEDASTTGVFAGVSLRANETIASSPYGFWPLGAGLSAWVGNAATGVTHQIGFYDADYALTNIEPGHEAEAAYFSVALATTASGHVIGESLLKASGAGWIRETYHPNLPLSSELAEGTAAWVADSGTGVTVRYGLIDGAHTMPAIPRAGEGAEPLSTGGFQYSAITGDMTSTGFFTGISMQFGSVTDAADGDGPMVNAGASVWVGNVNKGKTYQVGLVDAAHTSAEGVRQAYLYSTVESSVNLPVQVTDDGFVAGESVNYSVAGEEGMSAWMAAYQSGSDTYLTTRLGFFGADAGGLYRSADGYEYSGIDQITKTGLIGGFSEMHGGAAGSDRYESAWVVDAHTMALTEVGLTDAAHLYGADHYRAAFIHTVTDTGLVAGESLTFGVDGSDQGSTAWVQKVANSIDGTSLAAEVIGLYANENKFTEFVDDNPVAEHADNFVTNVTQSGSIEGTARRFTSSGASNGQDVWVAYQDGAHFTTDQVGLTGGEYVKPVSGEQYSRIQGEVESGLTLGYSRRYYTQLPAGEPPVIASSSTAWMATRQPAEHYVTTAIGLYDGFHTRADGLQRTTIYDYTNSGYISGYSENYGANSAVGHTAWVVSAGDGVTHQVGLTGSRYTTADGTRYSSVDGLTESGYAWGFSDRYTDDGLDPNGQAAWVYAFADNSLHVMDISENLAGYAYASIRGVTEAGLAYGTFELFDAGTGESLGYRAFGWTLTDGFFLLSDRIANDTSGYNWGELTDVLLVSEDGTWVGLTENGSVFSASAVPEPTTYAALAGAAMLGWVVVRRRRSGGREAT